MLQRFLQFGKENKLLDPANRFLLAVSGGPDSVVLAHLFREAGFRFALAHCNFSLRGKESDADEAFVRRLSKQLKVDCYVQRFEAQAYSKEKKISIQEAARDLRYAWFEKIRKEKKYTRICTAHHGDDSAETFFINLLRGTGLNGLTGIPVVNGRIIRPLLFATKAELLAFANEKKIGFREDSSNRSDKYLRNRIRHSLIPLLEELRPDFCSALLEEMGRLADARRVLDALLEKEKKNVVQRKGTARILSVPALKNLKPLRFFLFGFLREFGFNASVVDDIARWCLQKSQPGKTFYSATHELIAERGQLRILKRKTAEKSKESFLIPAGTASYNKPFAFSTEEIKRLASFKWPAGSETACLDADRLQFPLMLRKWKAGDRFQPLGMKGSKLLSDYFTDRKFSREQKSKTWVLESAGEIAWLVGHRIDERFKLQASSGRIFILHLD